jgi:hydrogenase expression/formation protein HypC
MCLGELAEVLEVSAGGTALVRSAQRTSTVSLLALEEPVTRGDWVVCHSGFALSRVSGEQAADANAIRSTGSPPALPTTTEDPP